MNGLVVVVSAVVTLLYASVLEWTVHRFGYHQARVWAKGTALHTRHHRELYPARSFYEWGARYQTSQPWWLEVIYVAAHAPVLAALAVVSVPTALTAALVLGTYAALTHFVHPATHVRSGRALERTRLFKLLVARHVRHHHDTSINFNLLLPFGDWLFGTLGPSRTERTSAPTNLQRTWS